MPSIAPYIRVFALTILAISLPPSQSLGEEIRLTPAQMREDLTFLKQEWAPLDKSLTPPRKAAFQRFVERAMLKTDNLTTQDFAFEIMQAVALARNGHTNANIYRFLGEDLPIRTWWFADGLHIVKTHPQFARLLGARIEKIGSITAAEAQERLTPYLAGNRQRARFLGPGYLVTPSVLKRIGAIDDAAQAPLALRLRDGTREMVNLKPTADADPGDERKMALNRGYGVLIPDDKQMPGRWPHVLDTIEKHSPLYAKRGDVSAAFPNASGRVIYIRNDSLTSVDNTPLTQKFATIIRESMLTRKPRHAIVDLRLNNGGDFFNSILFAQALPRLLPRQGRVFVLVSRATFSAGIVTAAMLRGAGRGKTVFIGEAVGDNARFWAEGKKKTLPNSHIDARYSSEFEDYQRGCDNIDTCYWATVAFGPRNISLAPDIALAPTFADYASGKDPALDRAMTLAR